MLFFTEVFASADMAYRQERIKRDFARVSPSAASRRRPRAGRRLARRRQVYRPAGASG